MKKLYLAFLALLCCTALAMPVYADVASPASILFSPELILIAVLIVVAGFVLYLLLHKRNK